MPEKTVQVPMTEDVEKAILRVEKAIEEIRAGRMVVLVDDEDRENEGDLCMAAEKVTPEAINFMAKEGRGLICVTLTPEKVERLGLPMMAQRNESPFGTNFTVSIEARHGVTTGISAYDRAHTIRTVARPDAKPEDIVTPGHVFPLKAMAGGVLVRPGQTEGSVDLARLAGLEPAGVICEIMNDDGTMARRPQLEEFCKRHNLHMLSISDIVVYRLRHEMLVTPGQEITIRPEGASRDWIGQVFTSTVSDEEFFVLRLGRIEPDDPVLIRVHHSCILSDVFAFGRCGCGRVLRRSIRLMEEEGRGAILYVVSHGDRIEEEFRDHIVGGEKETGVGPKAARSYGLGAQVLRYLGVRKMRLITRSEHKIRGIRPFGLEVVEQVLVT